MIQVIDKIARREKLKAEGWPKTLSELFERTGLTLDNCIHVCIDNQDAFIDTRLIEKASDKINQSIAPSFNRIGIMTYWIVWPKNDPDIPRYISDLEERGFMSGMNQLRNARPADIDRIIPKDCRSAFTQWKYGDAPTLTEQLLEKDGAEILFVTGFYADRCVMDTVVDACEKGYLVVWLQDGTDIYSSDNEEYVRFNLGNSGVIFAESEDVLNDIRQRALVRPSISV